MHFERGALRSHFTRGPGNYVLSPAMTHAAHGQDLDLWLFYWYCLDPLTENRWEGGVSEEGKAHGHMNAVIWSPLLGDKLRHLENFKSLFEQKSI